MLQRLISRGRSRPSLVLWPALALGALALIATTSVPWAQPPAPGPGVNVTSKQGKRGEMRPEEFERRFRDCREMPGSNDPAYRSAFNEMIMEAGGSITIGGKSSSPEALDKLSAAGADDEARWWSNVGASPMDARLAAFSDLYADAAPDQRQILRDFFVDEQLRELEQFVARAARLFETTGDPQWLRRGFAAACIEGGRYDYRDLIASLSILRYGAERAGLEVEPFFREALEMDLPGKSAQALSLEEILLTVKSYPKQTLRDFVRSSGPPEWQDEVKPE